MKIQTTCDDKAIIATLLLATTAQHLIQKPYRVVGGFLSTMDDVSNAASEWQEGKTVRKCKGKEEVEEYAL